MGLVRLILHTLSRLSISVVFLSEGIKNLLNWHEAETELMVVLSDWQAYFVFSQTMQVFFSQLSSWSSPFLLLATSLLFVGGVLTMMGIREKLAASLLLCFLIPITILYHPFWWEASSASNFHTVMFLKNLALVGFLIQTLLLQRSETSQYSEYIDNGNYPPMNY